MTNEQLEKQISEEFDKYNERCDNESGSFSSYQLVGIRKMAFTKGFKAASLPLMKKIEELEKARDYWKFQYDGENADYIKLQKENEELREALDWVINNPYAVVHCKHYINKVNGLVMTIENFGELEIFQEIRTKFNLDKEGES